MVNSIMGNNGRGIVLCGNSLEDMERGMEALRSALNSGAKIGIGASSVPELELAMDGLRQMVASHRQPSFTGNDFAVSYGGRNEDEPGSISELSQMLLDFLAECGD